MACEQLFVWRKFPCCSPRVTGRVSDVWNRIILIENDSEHFEFPLTSSPRLRLNDGNYKISHIVDGITMSTNEISIFNSDSLTFYIETLTLQDQLLTVAIVLEIAIALFLTFRLVRTYYQS